MTLLPNTPLPTSPFPTSIQVPDDGPSIEADLYESMRICPVGFAHEALGVQLWNKQQEVLNAVRDHRRVAVKAGNGLGKGFTAATAVLWFLCTHHPAIVLTTAPTARQVRHVLWREIRRLHRGAHQPIGGRMLSTRFEAADDRFALGLSTDDVDQFQGFHSPNMLIVVDRLKELNFPVAGINVGRPARQRRLFANMRAEGYWRLYELFNQEAIAIPNDTELAGQLASLRHRYNSKGQFYMETKDEARARGVPSPDKADALMLAYLGHNPTVRLYI